MAVRELILNEGKDNLLGTALQGRTVYGLLSTKQVIGAFTAGAVALPVATYPVDDTSTFPASGSFVVFGQTVTYTGKTGTTFTGCTGGTGTVADNALCLSTTGFQVTDTVATGAAEITGTAYARISKVVPAPTNGIITFSAFTWNTGVATNWPAAVRSLILATAASGGLGIFVSTFPSGPYDMSGTNANLALTPTVFLQNIGGGQ